MALQIVALKREFWEKTTLSEQLEKAGIIPPAEEASQRRTAMELSPEQCKMLKDTGLFLLESPNSYHPG